MITGIQITKVSNEALPNSFWLLDDEKTELRNSSWSSSNSGFVVIILSVLEAAGLFASINISGIHTA
jgi:autonomous glycyl radical cofactor GrcA